MAWPSQSVPQGGIFHPAKVNYSSDTQKFLKLLIDESKFSMQQRKSLNYHLRNGEPLPSNLNSSRQKKNPHIPEITIRPSTSKRRTKQTIVESGVYEREIFVPQRPIVDREAEKQRLQEKMAYDKEIPRKLVDRFQKEDTKKKNLEEINRFDQIVKEIEDREDFLKKMEELGEAEKYRGVIRQQIEAKLREMKKLKMQ